jgi:hypothetical protein
MLAWTLEEPAVNDSPVSDAVARPQGTGKLLSGKRSGLGRALFKIAARETVSGTAAPHFAAHELYDSWESAPLPLDEPLLSDELVDPTEADRRAHPRHDSECDVWISLRPPHLESGTTGRIRGRVVDVSLGGFALRTTAPVTPGHRIWMRIANRHFAQVIESDGTALRCTPQTSGDWHVVCRLSRRLTFEQVNFIGKQLFASTLV